MITDHNLEEERIGISWHGISVQTRDSYHKVDYILKDCNGRALSSKITGIFGTTGSGKTTLVNTLTGRLDPTLERQGDVLIDGNIRKESWLHTIAFVDEYPSFQKYQTVYETILSAFKMLDMNKDENELKEVTTSLIDTVGLFHKLDENVENLSKGELKLLNIGVALAEDPSVLILDDPFGAIDFFHKNKLLNIFKDLIWNNKTVIFTFSNPDNKFVNFIDNLIILVDGTTIFEGSIENVSEHWFNCGFENENNLNLLELVHETIATGEDNEEKNVICKQNARRIKDNWQPGHNSNLQSVSTINVNESPENNIHRTWILLKRHFVTIYRNKELLRWLIIQKICLFIAASLVYPRIGYKQDDIETRIGIVSFFVLNATERAGVIIMGTFAEYREITKREIYSCIYSPTEAYWAKFLYNSTLGFVFSVVYIIPVYWISNVNNNFWRFLLFILNQFTLTNFIVAYTIVVGIYTRNHLMAHIQGSLLFFFFIVFSGIFVNIGTIGQYIRWVTWISPMYYAYESNLQVSMSNLSFECGSESCYNTGKEVLDSLHIGRIHYLPALIIQWIFIFTFIVVGWYSFSREYKPKLFVKRNSLLNVSN